MVFSLMYPNLQKSEGNIFLWILSKRYPCPFHFVFKILGWAEQGCMLLWCVALLFSPSHFRSAHVTCVLVAPCWLHHVHRQTKSSIAAITITLPATVTQGPTSMKFLQRIEPWVWLIDGYTIIYLRGFHGFYNLSPHPQLRTCDLSKLYRERRDLT